MHVQYSTEAQDDLRRLPKMIKKRITQKVEWFAVQNDPLYFAEPLVHPSQKIYRFRIGDYRAIFVMKNGIALILLVLAVRHRKDAYR